MRKFVAKRSEKVGEGSGLNVSSFEKGKLYELDETSQEVLAYEAAGTLARLGGSTTITQDDLDELSSLGLLR